MNLSDTEVVIGPIRVSYVKLWEPKAVKGGDKEYYGLQIRIPKKDKATVAEVKAAITAAMEKGAKKLEGVPERKLKLPWQDGDKDFPNDPDYKGHYYFNANNTAQPGIVKKVNGVSKPIVDEKEVYSGMYAMIHINFFAFNNGSAGVSASLQNVMKVKDGPRMDGRKSAEQAFESVDFDTETDEETDDTPIRESKGTNNKFEKKKRSVLDDDDDDEPTPIKKKRSVLDDDDDEEEPAPKQKRKFDFL